MSSVPAAAAASTARDFMGVFSEDVFDGGRGYRSQMLPAQWDAGARVVRQDFEWRRIEPFPGQYDFSYYDQFVRDLAGSGLRVLPVLLAPPSFRSLAPPGASSDDMYPPRSPADYGRFAATVARRYGQDGSFWSANPDLPALPVRSWQIWNEPNLPMFWASGPDPGAYSRVLAAAAEAIEEVDPGAEIVAAGMPESTLAGAIPIADFLGGMYAAGAPRFDTFALHAYARNPAGSLGLARRVRALLDSRSDSAPIWITELGWASGGRPSRFTVSEDTQAAYIEEALNRFSASAAELRLRGLVLFKWRDSRRYSQADESWPHFAGLLRADGTPKPAYFAFRRAAGRLLAELRGAARSPARRRCSVARGRPASVFVGVSAPGLMRSSRRSRSCQLRALAAAGVGLVRQPFRGRAGPAEDRFVRELAQYGIEVLPVIPADATRSAPHAAAALLERYGFRGRAWRGVPLRRRAPVRALQVFDRQNGHRPGASDARRYVSVLRRVRKAVDRIDGRVRLVTEGLDPQGAAGFLTALYRHGGGQAFDAVGVDLSRRPSVNRLAVLRRLRRVMLRHGGRADVIWPTAVASSSGNPPGPSGLRRQALAVRRSLLDLRCRRGPLGIRGFVYARWRDASGQGPSTGLIDARGHPKQALWAFRAVARMRVRRCY